MKYFCACLLAALPAWAAAENPVFDELTTLEGRTYREVRIVSRDAARIRIEHSTGLASIQFDHLPMELRERFAYDPDAAQQLLAREIETNANSRVSTGLSAARMVGGLFSIWAADSD
jgi:hypothetical protein